VAQLDHIDYRVRRPTQARSAVVKIALKLLRIAVAGFLLYFIFTKIGLSTIIETMGSANLAVLVPALLATILVQLVAAYRLKLLIYAQGLDLQTSQVLEVNLAARFYGLFLPGGILTTTLLRAFKFTQNRSQFARVVTALFADRVLVTLALGFLGFLFCLPAQPDGLWLLAFVATFTACLIPTYGLFIRPFSFESGRVMRLLQRLPAKLWTKLSDAFQRSRLGGRKLLVTSLALSVAAHLICTISYWLIAQSLDVPLSLLMIGCIRAGMMLATLLPITIAGVGVREVAAIILLQYYGVEPDTAIAFSMFVFAITVFGIGLLGGLTEAWRFTRK